MFFFPVLPAQGTEVSGESQLCTAGPYITAVYSLPISDSQLDQLPSVAPNNVCTSAVIFR